MLWLGRKDQIFRNQNHYVLETNRKLTMAKRTRHQFFTEQNTGFTTDSIYIPDSPLLLKNNCKEGNWQLGDTNYGSRLKLVALKFSRYLHMGNDAIAAGAPIGQLWFCPIDGGIGSDEQGNEIQLALNLVYYTLLKNSKSGKSHNDSIFIEEPFRADNLFAKRQHLKQKGFLNKNKEHLSSGSLLNFGQKAALLQGQGIDYREVVWIPKFIKKSGTVTNDIGQAESASWYVLDWGVVLPEDQDDSTYNKIGNLIDILSSTEEMGKLIDPIVEGECRCVDGLKPQQIAQLANSMASSVNGSTPVLTPG